MRVAPGGFIFLSTLMQYNHCTIYGVIVAEPDASEFMKLC